MTREVLLGGKVDKWGLRRIGRNDETEDPSAGSSEPKEKSSSGKHRNNYQSSILFLKYDCIWKPI